ncbi:hypothetical protein LEP1GSC107_0219 [Leptospira interrogans serovar Grippotyphosa str. UI 12769]|nr:hypothetical protein LEP1GSC097_2576 [Leptospira interrogans serovar Grippotyphosa str. UI 08368]EMN87455.1 hypothetical protein LEP1GSC107_0219 [Leptospira interrogans serovar Grippotyphosa str. UI 12769]
MRCINLTLNNLSNPNMKSTKSLKAFYLLEIKSVLLKKFIE